MTRLIPRYAEPAGGGLGDGGQASGGWASTTESSTAIAFSPAPEGADAVGPASAGEGDPRGARGVSGAGAAADATEATGCAKTALGV